MPEFVAAFLVHSFVADHGELPRPGSDENQHAVSFPRLFHAEMAKLSLRVVERVAVQFASLDVDANFARGFCLRFLDGPDDPVMIELV
jgi:hypothetical protein